MRWNKVEQSLPSKNGRYLVTSLVNFGYDTIEEETSIAYFDEGGWSCNPGKIIAWAELPEPFKSSNEIKKARAIELMDNRAQDFKASEKNEWNNFASLITEKAALNDDDIYRMIVEKFNRLFKKEEE